MKGGTEVTEVGIKKCVSFKEGDILTSLASLSSTTQSCFTAGERICREENTASTRIYAISAHP